MFETKHSVLGNIIGGIVVFVAGNCIVRSIVYAVNNKDIVKLKAHQTIRKIKSIGKDKEEHPYTRY